VPTSYIAAILLAASMFFSLLSNALRGYSIARLEDRLKHLGRMKRLTRFLEVEDSLIQTFSVWRLLSLTTFIFVVAFRIGRLDFGRALTDGLLAAVALLAFGSALPLAWAKYHSEALIALCMPVMFFMRAASWPLLAFLKLVDGLVRRLSGVVEPRSRHHQFEDELRSVVKGGELEGTVIQEEKQMIESIIRVKKTDVGQIMTPRTEMLSLPSDALLSEARQFIATCGHARVPVYEGSLDIVVGVLYARDLLTASGRPGFETKPVTDIMRSALFVPETKNLTELLREFQRDGGEIAIILDEYGGTAGLLTIGDIFKEILGEVAGQNGETERQEILRLSDTLAEVDARVRIVEANSALGLALPQNEDYETVGGFVLSKLGFIPKAGDRLEYRGLTLVVLEAEERRINRVRVEGLDKFVRERD
jgi:putative hemolysin